MIQANISPSQQPIIDISMTGIHWINASAGTGKTYTLASVIVRLLIEQYVPKQIIATTFTRKAANELKVRVRKRVQEILAILRLLEQNIRQNNISQVQSQLTTLVQGDDPLWQKIASDLLANKRQLNELIYRLDYVMQWFDELYIGTLDSFTQKILREFSFESGQLQALRMSEQENDLIRQILHDSTRQLIASIPIAELEILHENNVLKSIDEYVSIVRTSLNFKSAKWQKIERPQLVKMDITPVDENAIAEFLQLIEQINLKKNSVNYIKKLLNCLKDNTWQDLNKADFEKLFIKAYEFNKPATEAQKQAFYDHPVLAYLNQARSSVTDLSNAIEQYEVYIKYYLVQSVQQQLPQLLQIAQETTFSEQVQTLANALNPQQASDQSSGELFAQMVHRRYPVILVDEFQDTNHYQDSIVQRIWRDPQRYRQGCCILVGDDKQAIYGFRGGDMLTYNHARHEIERLYQAERQAKQLQQVFFYTLIENHRTVQPLVEAVDALFQRNMEFGDEVRYPPIKASHRQHEQLIEVEHEQVLVNHQPLRWLNLSQTFASTEEPSDTNANHQTDQIAWQILQLLAKSQRGQLYFQNQHGEQRPVVASDIAVLVRKGAEARDLADYLRREGVPCLLQDDRSVFDSGIARDVGHILAAILQPYQEDKIKRALLTQLFAKSVQEIKTLEQQNKLSQYMQDFMEMKQDWQHYGFLNAWQSFLLKHEIWQNLMYVPAFQRERLVINLRHLTDILANYSAIYTGQNRLLSWYQKQLNAPLNREWEIERKLSQTQGVQLLTIHKAKGLEFKIVFTVEAEKKLRLDSDLVYSEQDQQRHIGFMWQADEVQKAQNQQRMMSEDHRLWYVAMTRASYRLYITVSDRTEKDKDDKKHDFLGVDYWRFVDGLDDFSHPYAKQENLIWQKPQLKYQHNTANQPMLNAKTLQYVEYKEQIQISYTALTLGQVHHQQDNLSQNSDDDETEQYELNDESQNTPLPLMAELSEKVLPIQYLFPRGTDAGTQLHSLFEKIDFQQEKHWYDEIKRHFKGDYQLLNSELWAFYQAQYPSEQQPDDLTIKSQFYSDMCQWLDCVLSTPIVQQPLKHIPPQHRVMELEFYLALDQHLSMEKIKQLFKRYAIDLNLQNIERKKIASYLKGAIDMVFFDGERYHILDYKSNYLGDHFAHYTSSALAKDMSKHQYWLQASIYLVALHRYLKVHLKHYQLTQHLGTAHYAYLRGMNGQQGQGVYSWQDLDMQLIVELDEILGYSEIYQHA